MHAWMGTDSETADQCLNCGVIVERDSNRSPYVIDVGDPRSVVPCERNDDDTHYFTFMGDDENGIAIVECAFCGTRVDGDTDTYSAACIRD